MNPNRLAKRILYNMLELTKENERDNLNLMIGLGLSLAFLFEEMTGRSTKNMKPKELMAWAMELPDEKENLIRLVQ